MGLEQLSEKYLNLIAAIKKDDLTTAREILLLEPSLVNQTNDLKQTPLFFAAGYGRFSIVEIMLKPPIVNHVDFTIEDVWGRDPIDIALEAGHSELAQNLYKISFPDKETSKETATVTVWLQIEQSLDTFSNNLVRGCRTFISSLQPQNIAVAFSIAIVVLVTFFNLINFNSDKLEVPINAEFIAIAEGHAELDFLESLTQWSANVSRFDIRPIRLMRSRNLDLQGTGNAIVTCLVRVAVRNEEYVLTILKAEKKSRWTRVEANGFEEETLMPESFELPNQARLIELVRTTCFGG